MQNTPEQIASAKAEIAPLNPVTCAVFSLTALAAVIAVPWYGVVHGYQFASWLIAFAFLWASGLSITAGYHRYWAHRSYQLHPFMQVIFMLFGTAALQHAILGWASQHRTHHRYVDDVEKDPYSIRRGFWFAHMGWILRNYKSGFDDFSNARDLERDPLVMFQYRHYVKLVLLMNVALPLFLGWLAGDAIGTFLLAGVLRVVLNHHFTFFINSLAHMWGAQPYTDENTAKDNGLVAFFTYGEGYHNFHHIFDNDYRNGVKWWAFDPGKWLIATLAFFGLARGLKRTPAVRIRRAQMDMQFKRLQRKLENPSPSLLSAAQQEQLERFKLRVNEEYDAFKAAVDEWGRIREAWVIEQKRRLTEKWDDSAFKAQLKDIERKLAEQQRRLNQLQTRYA
jgi:stearoyl-CoA desaturase (Delta-9 desaturase)